jgi:nitrilase
MPKLAIIQQAPVVLDRVATLQEAVRRVDTAAAAGATLIVLPESFVPCYPAWIWRLRPGPDSGLTAKLHARLVDNAVSIVRGDLAPLCSAAREHRVTIVCGMTERDDDLSRGTIYNTAVVIGDDGSLRNKHRKLMPTNPERMVWGFGDGSTLNVVDTSCGRIGTMLCWESYMPLALRCTRRRRSLHRADLRQRRVDRNDAAHRGCCWVGQLTLPMSRPAGRFSRQGALYPDADEWINDGDSVVVAPGGKIVAGPLRREAGILYADIDLEAVAAARRRIDVAGHYARPDVFRLHVNRQRQSPVSFD